MRSKKEIASLEKNRPEPPSQDAFDKWDRYVRKFKALISENLQPSQAYWTLEWCEHDEHFYAEVESTRFRTRAEAGANVLDLDTGGVPNASFKMGCVLAKDETVASAVEKIDDLRLRVENIADDMAAIFVKNFLNVRPEGDKTEPV